jgi:hypothetical protein
MLVHWIVPDEIFPENEPSHVVFTGFFIEYRTTPARSLWKRTFVPYKIDKKRRSSSLSQDTQDNHGAYVHKIGGLESGHEYTFRVAISMRPMTQLEREKAAGMASQWFWKDLNNKRSAHEQIDHEQKDEPFPGPWSAVAAGRLESSPAAPRDVTIAEKESGTFTIAWCTPTTDHGGVIGSFAIRYRLGTDTHWSETSALPVAQVARRSAGSSTFQHEVSFVICVL